MLIGSSILIKITLPDHFYRISSIKKATTATESTIPSQRFEHSQKQ